MRGYKKHETDKNLCCLGASNLFEEGEGEY
jgi:hypothetical protein